VNTIVLIVVVILALAVLYEALKQGSKSQDTPSEEELDRVTPTADEALPTQTGKFRAQQVLAKTEMKDDENVKEAETNPFLDGPDSPLPDPFSEDDS